MQKFLNITIQRASECVKMADFALLEIHKLILRENLSDMKIMKFPHSVT